MPTSYLQTDSDFPPGFTSPSLRNDHAIPASHSEPIAVPKSHASFRAMTGGGGLSSLHARAASSPAPATSPAAAFFSGFYSPRIEEESPRDPHAEGETLHGYILGATIGQGAFSVIKRAVSATDGSIVAIKIVATPTPASRRVTEREETLWRRLSHEHILPLFSSHRNPQTTYFITLYCPAGSLADLAPTLPPDDAGRLFRQVARALRYLHEDAHVVHGDIKLDNVLVDDCGACRLADFGLAFPIDGPTGDSEDSDDGHLRRRATLPARVPAGARVPPGSLPYAAPELLASRRGPPQDVWALGVLLYALLTHRYPFADAYEPRIRAHIVAGKYDALPGAAGNVVNGCLQTDPHFRWDAARVEEAAWQVGWGDDVPVHAEEGPRERRSRSRPGKMLDRSLSRLAEAKFPVPTTPVDRSRPRAAEMTRITAQGEFVQSPSPLEARRSRSRHHDDSPYNSGRSRSRDTDPGGVGPIRTRSQSRARSALTILLHEQEELNERRGRPRSRAPTASDSRSSSGPMTPLDEVVAEPLCDKLERAWDVSGDA